MEYKQFIIDLIDKTAWPIVVLVAVFLLRKQLGELVERLHSMKYKGFSAIFTGKLQETKEEAENANIVDVAFSFQEKKDYYEELANISPRAVVLESWLQLENVIESIVRKKGQEFHPRAFGAYSKVLLKDLGIKPEKISIFEDLRMLRNQAVHDQDISISPKQAIDYSTIALGMSQKIAEQLGDIED